MIPPAVAVTVEPVFKRNVVIVGASVRSMSLLTVIAPVLASPMTSLLAVMWSSSVSVSPSVPLMSAPPRSINWLPVFCFNATV